MFETWQIDEIEYSSAQFWTVGQYTSLGPSWDIYERRVVDSGEESIR